MRTAVFFLALLPVLARADDWQAEVQRRIANEEYRITRQKDRFHAANRAQNLRAYFDQDGVRIERRVSQGQSWKMGMRLCAVGRAGQMRAVPARKPILGRCVPEAGPGALKGCLRRLEYYHLDLLVIEWFENVRAGLKQGFELWLRPGGEGRLRLEQEISGARLSQAGDGVKLIPEGGRPLNFKGIEARDRYGRKLGITLIVEDGKLVTLVDDSRAVYPLFIQ